MDVKKQAAASADTKAKAMGCGVPGRKVGGRVGCDTAPLSSAASPSGGRTPK